MADETPRYGFDANEIPITEEYVAEAVREAEAGYDLEQLRSGCRAPVLDVALPVDLHDRAAREAVRRGCSIEHLALEALAQHLVREAHEPARYGYDRRGNPITDQYVADVVREAEAGFDLTQSRPFERPLPGSEPAPASHVTIALSDELHAKAARAASSRDLSVSQFAREALGLYLAS
jgi:predicted HicB family RNase H-like nuclease